MKKNIRFRLNQSIFDFEAPEERLVLDWVRREQGLTGTREGCREGDCGACTVMLGERTAAGVAWKAVPSCLLALGELDGRHLVTIEGVASAGLTPIMKALLDEGASQCGFCSPGIVLALTAFLAGEGEIEPERAVIAVEGNICRCTGYGSIRRAAERLAREFAELPPGLPERLEALGRAGVLPPELVPLMTDLPLPAAAASVANANAKTASSDSGGGASGIFVGGGTDYFVRNPHPEPGTDISFLSRDPGLAGISREGDRIIVGASVTVDTFFADPHIRAAAPGIERCAADIASLPIRRRATMAGNVTNASPIGDLSAILLALGAVVRIRPASDPHSGSFRTVPLEQFFLDYRKIDLREGEIVEAFELPSERVLFSFEKVSKRPHLDIATVNSACALRMNASGTVEAIRISAGGVAPVPLLLTGTMDYLREQRLDDSSVQEAARIAAEEIRPIDDVRGSAEYRRRLLERLVQAHFLHLFPELDLSREVPV